MKKFKEVNSEKLDNRRLKTAIKI